MPGLSASRRFAGPTRDQRRERGRSPEGRASPLGREGRLKPELSPDGRVGRE